MLHIEKPCFSLISTVHMKNTTLLWNTKVVFSQLTVPVPPEIKHTFKYNYRKQFIQKTAAMKHGRQQQDASCLKFMYCVQEPGSWKLQLSTTALQSVVLWSSRINNDNNALKLIEDEENDWHSL